MVRTQMLNRTQRVLWNAAGFCLLGIGFVGYVVPWMPGTIFLILALACFVRSNEKMVAWMLQHPLFGGILRRWIENGSISTRIKVISCSCIVLFSVPGAVRAWTASPAISLGVLALGAVGIGYILSRPVA